MKRKGILGIGAGIGAAAAAVAAFFFQPGRGQARRQAVRRSGEAVARRSANVAALVGSPRRGSAGGGAELRSRIEDALIEALGGEGLALRVVVDDDTLAVRGEVATLDQISRASQAIERVRGDNEVVNLVRLRAPAVPRTALG